MATPAQIAANRANAQRSTGPHSRQGKDSARYNALRHGLRARAVVLPGEDPAEFQSFRDRMIRDMDVQGDYEKFLAERIVQDAWRINRGLALESHLFQRELDRPDDADNPEESSCALSDDGIERLGLFSRYQAHLERSLNRNARLLRAVQADRANQSRREEDGRLRDQRIQAPPPNVPQRPLPQAAAAAPCAAAGPADSNRQETPASPPEVSVNPIAPGEKLASFGKNSFATPRRGNPFRSNVSWPQRTTLPWKARPSRWSA